MSSDPFHRHTGKAYVKKKTARILIVEDEELVAESLRISLQELGYETIGVAKTGEEALPLAGQHKPDLVLMDISLEGELDGIETAGQILSDLEIPVVFLTAHVDEEIVERIRLTAPYGYLLKPFKETELHVVLQAALGRKVTEDAERRQTDAILEQERTRARQLLHTAEVMLIALNVDGRIVLANRKACEVLGYEHEEELLGCDWFEDFLPLSIRHTVLQTFHRLIADGIVPHEYFENPVLTRSGSEKAIAWHNVVLRDEDGNITGTLSSGEDITERKKIAQALRESERRYRLLTETTSDVIWTADLKLKPTYVSPSILALRGYTPEEVMNQRLEDILTPASFETAKQIMSDETSRGATQRVGPDWSPTFELEMSRKDGTTVWTETRLNVLFNENDRPNAIMGITRNITERKQAEEALRGSEELYRSLIEASPDAIVLTDLQGTVIKASAQTAQLFGFRSIEEGVSKDVASFIAEEDQARIFDLLWRTIEQGKAKDIECRLKTKDGSLFWAEISASVILNSEGEPWAFTAVIKDTTARKQTAECLRKSEERLAEAQRIVHLGNWDWDIETKELFWSDEVYRIFGLFPCQFETKQEAFWACVHPEDREYVTESVRQALTTGRPYSFDHRIVLPDGSEKVVREVAEVTSDVAGNPIRIAGTVQDITAHKQAEGRILWQNALLTGVKHVLEETLVCDSEEEVAGKCLSVAAELTGSKFGIIGVVNEKGLVDSIALSDPGWDACRIPRSNSVAMIRNMEIRGIWGRLIKDGKSLITNDPASHADSVGVPEGHPPLKSLLGVPLKHQGQTIGVIGLANKEQGFLPSDLEAVETLSISFVEALMRKRAEKEREKIQAQLRQAQKMEAIGTLAGGIAHDFNNILAAMIGFAELVRQQSPEPSPLRDNIEEVLVAGDRARSLIKQILAFSRQVEPERRPVCLDLIVKETVHLIRASFPSSIEIRQEIRAENPVALADPIQIQQVVLNLCTNARDAIEGAKGVVQISIIEVTLDVEGYPPHLSLRPGCYLKLTVSDTGCGMERSIQERIFEPFFSTKLPGRGTGMGLAMIHGIVRTLQGAIDVKTEPGKGTTFEVYLPRAESGSVEQPDERPKPEPCGGQGRILFVDDEPPLVRMYKQTIEKLGYDVVARTSSIEALEAFRANPFAFDLVITDMTMPNLTGVELARELASIRPGISVLLCTGFCESLSSEKARELGLRGVLMKPVPTHELAEAIRKALQTRVDSPTASRRGTVLVIDDEEPVRNLLRQILVAEGYTVLLAANGKQGMRTMEKNPADLVITDIFRPESDGLEMIRTVREKFPQVKLIAVSGGLRVFPGGDFLGIARALGADRAFPKPLPRKELLGAVREMIGSADEESSIPADEAA